MNKAVFFDRDNTIIKDVPYNGDPQKVELLPGAREGLKSLVDNGFLLILISNQSGVGRGLITKEQVQAVNNQVFNLLGNELFTAAYCCYDDPSNPQEHCRKPAPKMILQAQREHDIELENSFFVGDKLEDIMAGRNAGCKTALILYGNSNREKQIQASEMADFTSRNLADICNWINKTT